MNGFPWYTYRSIKTITYVLTSSLDYSDSLGKTDKQGIKQMP